MVGEPPDQGGYRPPPHQLTTWLLLGAVLTLLIGLISLRTQHQPDSTRAYPPRPQIADAEPVLRPQAPTNEEFFPCGDCHEDEELNPARRELEEEHDDLKLAHGELWCLHCHDLENRERLRLADGSLVEFANSWQLCTQCHGAKLADWRAGVHGKRTGHWRGPKEYEPCVTCHNPHEPPFRPLEPKPPPQPPEQIALGGDALDARPHDESH